MPCFACSSTECPLPSYHGSSAPGASFLAWLQFLAVGHRRDEANRFTHFWICLVIARGHIPCCSIHSTMRLWEQVMEPHFPEHFIYPGVLTLPSILHPTNELKGQPQQSCFSLCFAHLSGARVEWGAFGSSSGPKLLETCCLWTKNKIICFSFSLFLDCPCLSLQASCLCCVWKAQVVSVFMLLPRLSHLS